MDSNGAAVNSKSQGSDVLCIPGTTIVIPRNYAQLIEQWQRRRADFFHLLTNDKMESIRSRFMDHDNELRLVQFVFVMLESLSGFLVKGHILHFIEKLIDLFRQVDINDDGTMEWEELTSYIYESGLSQDTSVQSSVGTFIYDLITTHKSAEALDVVWMDVCVLRSSVEVVAVSKNSSLVVFYQPLQEEDGSISLRSTGKCLRHNTAFYPHAVTAAVLLPEYSAAVTASAESAAGPYWLSRWDVGSGECAARVPASAAVTALAWAAAPRLVFTAGTGSGPGTGTPIVGRAMTSLAAVLTIIAEGGPTTTLTTLAPTLEQHVLAGSQDGNLTLWRYGKREAEAVLRVVAHTNGVKAVAHCRVLRRLASIGFSAPGMSRQGHSVLVWDLEAWRRRGDGLSVSPVVLARHYYPLTSLQWVEETGGAPPHLLTLDDSGTMFMWDAATLKCLQMFDLLPSPHKLLDAKAEELEGVDGAAASLASEPLPADADVRSAAPPLLRWVGAMCVVPRGPVTRLKTPALALGGNDIRYVKLTQRVPQPSPLVKVIYVRPSFSFVTATAHSILVWDALTGRISKVFASLIDRAASEEICDIATDDRERKLIVGTSRGRLRVINLENGAVMKDLEPHSGAVTGIAYHNRSRRVATAAVDGCVQVSEEESLRGYNAVPYISTIERRCLVPLRNTRPQLSRASDRAMSPLRLPSQSSQRPTSRQKKTETSNALPSLHHHASTPAAAPIKAEVTAFALSEALNLIATASQIGHRRRILFWEFDSGRYSGVCAPPPWLSDKHIEINALAFVPGLSCLLSGTSSGLLLLWRTKPSELAGTLAGIIRLPQSAAVTGISVQRRSAGDLHDDAALPGVPHKAEDANKAKRTGRGGDNTAAEEERERKPPPPLEASPLPSSGASDKRKTLCIIAADDCGRMHIYSISASALKRASIISIAGYKPEFRPLKLRQTSPVDRSDVKAADRAVLYCYSHKRGAAAVLTEGLRGVLRTCASDGAVSGGENGGSDSGAPDALAPAASLPAMPLRQGATSDGAPQSIPFIRWHRSWQSHAGAVSSVASTPGGHVASSGSDGMARVWSLCGTLLGCLHPVLRFQPPETPEIAQCMGSEAAAALQHLPRPYKCLLSRRMPRAAASTALNATFLTESSSGSSIPAAEAVSQAVAPYTECAELAEAAFPPGLQQRALWRFIPELRSRSEEDGAEAKAVYAEVRLYAKALHWRSRALSGKQHLRRLSVTKKDGHRSRLNSVFALDLSTFPAQRLPSVRTPKTPPLQPAPQDVEAYMAALQRREEAQGGQQTRRGSVEAEAQGGCAEVEGATREAAVLAPGAFAATLPPPSDRDGGHDGGYDGSHDEAAETLPLLQSSLATSASALDFLVQQRHSRSVPALKAAAPQRLSSSAAAQAKGRSRRSDAPQSPVAAPAGSGSAISDLLFSRRLKARRHHLQDLQWRAPQYFREYPHLTAVPSLLLPSVLPAPRPRRRHFTRPKGRSVVAAASNAIEAAPVTRKTESLFTAEALFRQSVADSSMTTA